MSGPSQKSARKIIHTCDKEEVIKRMSVIIVGNGKPEDGLAFKVRQFVDNQNEIKKSIKDINDTVKTALEAATKASNALNIYKIEMASYEAGKKATKDSIDKQASSKWMKMFQTGMLIIAALGLTLTTYFSIANLKTSESTYNRVDDLGAPVITRGGEIKFFPKDFMNDSVIIKKTSEPDPLDIK